MYCSSGHKLYMNLSILLLLYFPLRLMQTAHDVAAKVPTVSEPPAPAVPSRSALRLLFSMTSSFLCPNIFICLSSTPFSQYPKEPPMLANSGYTHNAPRWKKGLISMLIWTILVAMPVAC